MHSIRLGSNAPKLLYHTNIVSDDILKIDIDLVYYTYQKEQSRAILFCIINYNNIKYRIELGIFFGHISSILKNNTNKINYFVHKIKSSTIKEYVSFILKFSNNKTYHKVLNGIDFGDCKII